MDIHKRTKELAAEAYEAAEGRDRGEADRYLFMVGYVGMHAALLEDILHNVYGQLPRSAQIRFNALLERSGEGDMNRTFLPLHCKHRWVANSGNGGIPHFRYAPMMHATENIMHVKCSQCGARTWFTVSQWNELTGEQPSKGIDEEA